MEGNWPKRQDGFTGFIHRFDLFLESARGDKGPDLVISTDVDRPAGRGR